MPEHDDEELLEANDAVKYLAERWHMDSYSLEAFRMLRRRRGITPTLRSRTSTFWRKSDLDAIPHPDRSGPRGPHTKKTPDDAEADKESEFACAV